MTGRNFTRRRLGQTALAGAALLGAPLPLRDAFAQGAPANLKVGLLLRPRASRRRSARPASAAPMWRTRCSPT